MMDRGSVMKATRASPLSFRVSAVLAIAAAWVAISCGKAPVTITPLPSGKSITQKEYVKLCGTLERTFTGFFDLESRNLAQHLKISVYENEEEWKKQLVSAFGPDSKIEVIGYFNPTNSEIHLGVFYPVYQTKLFFTHEVTHLFVHGYFGKVDIWLNEGLAQYFECNTLEGRFHATANAAYKVHFQQWLREKIEKGEFKGIKTMLWTREIFEFVDHSKERLEANYTVSWAIVDTLNSELGDAFPKAVLEYVRIRQSPEPGLNGPEAAFRRAFGMKIYRFEEALVKRFSSRD